MIAERSLENMLIDIGRHGLAHVDKILLVEVAMCIWYSDVVPDLRVVPAELHGDVGYLLDRLARFNILSKPRKLQMLAALTPYKVQHRPAPASSCQDPLAVEWGASADLTPLYPTLLPYQTRHFAATR
jgi:hypothetical protein